MSTAPCISSLVARRARVVACCAAVALAPAGARGQSLEFGYPYVASGDFAAPCGVAFDSAGDQVLVADTANHRIAYASVASLTGAPTWSDLGGPTDPAAPGALSFPQGVIADADGDVYAIDTVSGVLRLFRPDLAGGYTLDPGFTAATPHVVDGVAIRLPRDVAIGADGRVYLLDSGNNRVLVADGPADDSWSVHAASTAWSNPYGLDVDADGTLWIADSGNHVIRGIAADGSETVYGGYGTASGSFRDPRDVAVGPDGRIFVADTQNHRVVVLRSDGAFSVNLGTAPLFASPQKVAVDARGRVLVVDSDAARVIAFLGSTVPPAYDLYVRDYYGDAGAQPFTGPVLFSPDILVRSQPDVDTGAGLDGYLFDPPRPGQDSYAYVAIRNRGTQIASGAVVRFYWADPSGAMAFPADWHTDGFSIPGAAGGAPTPGNALPVPDVAPQMGGVDGVQVVGPIVWRPPEVLRDRQYVLLVRVLAPYDALVAARGLADVKANNGVALRPVSTSDEALDGSFMLDLSGDVYVQLIHSKAGYASYLAFEEPATSATCSGLNIGNCYLETRKCRKACPQANGDYTCACIANETRLVGRYQAGQRFAAKFMVDKDRNGTVDRTYYVDQARNWDGFDHVRTYHVFQGAWILEFEDFDNGGDRDFNDLVVMVRVVPDAISREAAQLPAPSLYLLSNVVVEDAAKVPDPKVRLTVLLQNSDVAQSQRAAVCPMLHFSEAREPSQIYTFRDASNGAPGDGTPDHVGPGDERVSVRFSRDQRWTNAPPHPAPRAGDFFVVPAATAAGPGEAAVEYEIPISRIDALITDPVNKLGGLGTDALQRRIATNGLAIDLLTNVMPSALVCPSGPMTSFDGLAGQVATVQTAWTDPNTYRIASPAFIDVPTVNFQTRDPSVPPVLAYLEYFWSDNLPEHLKGHIQSTIPPRTPFWAGGAAVSKVPVRLDFADDMVEGFQGKLEVFVRDVYTGAVIVTATRTFSKDNHPPTVSAVHTTRTGAAVDVAATIADPSGIGEAWLGVDVAGVRRTEVFLSRVTGDYRSATEFTATVGALAPLDVVTLDLTANDRARLATPALRLPVANVGDPSFECNAAGPSVLRLDGTRSTGPADLAFAWKGPFGTATGPTPTVLAPIGEHPIELTVTDGRGFAGTQTATLSVRDTVPPALEAVATPACVWPPNHKYVPFRIGENLGVEVHDLCDASPRYRVVGVTSDEPDDGLGDGDTGNDVTFGDDGFCVRAERGASGKGRTYTATLEAVDATGNRTERIVTVSVPHDASVDERCPYLPTSVFAEDGEARCRFGPVASGPPSTGGAQAPGAAPSVKASVASGCATGGTGSPLTALLLVGAALGARLRRRNASARAAAAVLLLVLAPTARAGGVAATNPMSEAREGHTATRLQDGRVLVVGGRGTGELASAELYDPSTGAWSAAGSLASARRGHTATLLADGRVVVIGGSVAGQYGTRVYPAAAEIYTPGSGWSTSGSLATPRSNHTATLLADGRVLVAGGYNLGDIADCEIFDPAAGTFTPTDALSTRRYGHEAVRLGDGRVLVLGGASSAASGKNFTSTAEIWSPTTGEWAAAAALLAPRYRFAAALLPDGVLVAGGSNDDGVLGAAEVYDPNSGSSAVASLALKRTSAATARVEGGAVVAGGYDLDAYGTETQRTSVARFDAASRRWSSVGDLTVGRSASTATVLADDSVLIAGGWDGSAAVATAEIIPAAALANASPGGCGCGTSSGSGAELAVVVLVLLALRGCRRCREPLVR